MPSPELPSRVMSSPSDGAPIPVLIVGAGPTGLVLALWLTALGVRVRIIDTTAGLGTTSRALAVQARTLELYEQLGIASEVIQEGVRIRALNLWVSGKRAARVELANMGEGVTPFSFALAFPQDAHERLLVAQLEARGVLVERRTELLHFEQRPDAIDVRLRAADGTEERCTATWLAGCDGAHSAVRHGIGVDYAGGTYSELFYVADLSASGPTVNEEIHLDLDEADFLAMFPLARDNHVRVVGSVTAGAAQRGDDITFADIDTRLVDGLGLAISKVNWFSSYRVHHRVASKFRVGRAFLLGDAAHIHSPAGGQGMNTGIGDAINLAWKLAAVIGGRAPASMLDTYETERIGFARKVVSTTDRVFTFVTKQGAIARFARTRLVPRIAPVLFDTAAVRRFIFRTVSQVGIEYRGSVLSSGAARDVHGGDRLPWVPLATGGDNYAPLRSMAWQAHVYGTASTALSAHCAGLQLPLHTFEWTPAMHSAGLARGALYLIRPDSYLALVDATANPSTLSTYFESLGLSATDVARAPDTPR